MTGSQHPGVEELFFYYPDWETTFVDAATAFDAQIRRVRENHDLNEVATELDRMVAASSDSKSAMLAAPRFLQQMPIWDGQDDYLAVLVNARDRVKQALADPSVIPGRAPSRDGLTLPRVSKFTDKETAERACTLVVRRNYAQLKEFEAGTTGWRSMHFFADLGSEVGTLGTVRVNDQEAGSQLGAALGGTVETSAVVMVMSRTLDTGEIFIETSYPELAVDESVRTHFPALCHFYGPWFGQDRIAPATAMLDVCTSTKEPAFSQLKAELDLLLSVVDDDNEMRRILEACGSYVLPQSVRHWVERTRWRLDAYDWLPAEPRVRRKWRD